MNAEQFYDFCVANPDLNAELSSQGEVVVISPSGAETSYRNCELRPTWKLVPA